MNSIDFLDHRSKVKVRKGIIDKCGVREDATLRVVIFSLFIAHFHWLKCTLLGKVIPASP